MAAPGKPFEGRLDAFFIGAIMIMAAYYTLWGVAHATDRAFAIQMWTALAALLAGFAFLVHFLGRGPISNRSSKYEDGVVKAGVIASMFWGIAGFLVGVIIAAQLAYPNIFYFEELGWTNFGRLRPCIVNEIAGDFRVMDQVLTAQSARPSAP